MAEDNREPLSKIERMKGDTAKISALLRLAENYDVLPVLKTSRMKMIRSILNEARKLNNVFKVDKFRNRIDILSAEIQIDENPILDIKKLLTPVIDRCHKTFDIDNESRALQTLAVYLPNNPGSRLYKLKYYRIALADALQSDQSQSAFYIRGCIARTYAEQGNLEMAENELLQLLRSERKATHSNRLFINDLLCDLYKQKGQYQKALAYGLQTVKMVSSRSDSLYLLGFYSRVADIHKDLGNYVESLAWYEKAYAAVLRMKENQGLIIAARTGIINDLLELKRPHEALRLAMLDAKNVASLSPNAKRLHLVQLSICYEALRMNADAERTYMQLIDLVAQNDKMFSDVIVATCYHRTGDFYLSIGRPWKAKPFLLKALTYAEPAASVSDMKDIYLSLFRADSAVGKYHQAINYLQKSNKLKDAVFNTVKEKQIQELQVRFNTEQKNKDIQNLQTAAQVQMVSLNITEATRNWIIAAGSLVMIIAVLLYRQALTAKRNHWLIQKKNRTLQQFVREKEWLLEEVHHRVKDNLHTLTCLLEMQAKYLKDDALKAIETSQNRIFAMSLIHQKLYRSKDIQTIDMAEYIPDLVFNLQRSFDTADQIRFDLEISPILLQVSHAIAFGLIINEAVTNAIKYAFPEKQSGRISIMLNRHQDKVVLSIADNGIGMPCSFHTRDISSLGIELMKGLCQDLNGEITFDSINGTRIVVTCGPDACLEKVDDTDQTMQFL